MLHIRHVTKYYVKSKPVISDMNLSFPATGLNIIVGKSGCGKTTLLNMIGTMDQDYIGSIEFDEIELSSLSYRKMSEYRNYQSSFIFQINSLFEHLTVEENIRLALNLQGKNIDLAPILERVGLAGFEKKKVKSLSGGERQRVGIARALAKDSKIVLADEPTSALDSKNGHKIFALLKEISKDRLVIVVTHDVKKASIYADRMVRLVDGRVVEDNIINHEERPVVTYKKKAIKSKLLWPIFRFQFMKTLLINLFITLLLAASLTVVNIAKEQEAIKAEYDRFNAGETAEFNPFKALSTHVANNVDQYNVVRAIETDKPYTYFQEVSTRNGGLTPEDYPTIENLLTDYNVHYGNAEYGNIMIDGAIKQYKMSESYEGVVYYWYEPQRSPFTYYVYDETNEYDLLVGSLPQYDHQMMITDTVADAYLRRNEMDPSDPSVLLGQDLTIFDIYGQADTCYLYVPVPFEVCGIIKTTQLQYYYYDYQSKLYNLLDGIVQQTRTDPYMNSALFQPYGYIVTPHHLDSYLNNHYYEEGVTFEAIQLNDAYLNRRSTTTFHGYYDYKGITSYEDNLAMDVRNRLYIYDETKVVEDDLTENQIVITLQFARILFPTLPLTTTPDIINQFDTINGTEVTLSFKSMNGVKDFTFEIVGIAASRYDSYFYVSPEMYGELYRHNNPITYSSITVGLEGTTARERMKIIDTLYQAGYVLVPVSMAPGVWGEFVPTQGEVVLVDDEGFETEANISIFHLFSTYYNTQGMNDTNYALEIVSSISSFVFIMAIILSIGFIYLKERRQRDYTNRLTALGVPTNKIVWMNLINYVMIALLVGGLSLFATQYIVGMVNNAFTLSIQDIQTIGVIHRIRILFTNASIIRSVVASVVILIMGIITASIFVYKSKK
ncbi:MAG: ABC transporter ATP-binding protein [Bacilli bacterium]|nr:ABC transporter ATP-binding protein [Bacilli bacterium]